MKSIRNAVLGLSAMLALGACGAGNPEGHWAEGVVESVDAPARQVTIDHGEIPDLMGAMTMTFDVSDPALLEGLEPGSPIRFAVEYKDGSYLVTAIEKK